MFWEQGRNRGRSCSRSIAIYVILLNKKALVNTLLSMRLFPSQSNFLMSIFLSTSNFITRTFPSTNFYSFISEEGLDKKIVVMSIFSSPKTFYHTPGKNSIMRLSRHLVFSRQQVSTKKLHLSLFSNN